MFTYNIIEVKTLSQDDTMKTPVTQSSEEPTPVYARHKTPWDLCLIREKNRCPGSELFNESEAFSKFERYGDGEEISLNILCYHGGLNQQRGQN